MKRGDKVLITIPLKHKILGAISIFRATGRWCWPPTIGYIYAYREEMVAYEVLSFPDKWAGVKTYYIVPERLKLIPRT